MQLFGDSLPRWFSLLMFFHLPRDIGLLLFKLLMISEILIRSSLVVIAVFLTVWLLLKVNISIHHFFKGVDFGTELCRYIL